VDATFGDVLVRPLVDLDVSTTGNGSVQVDPQLDGQWDTYLHGDTVTLTATADPGWAFVGWSGDLSSAENPAAFALAGDTNVEANFGLERRLDVDVEGDGVVTLDPEGPIYGEGSLVRLRPTASASWTFIGWSGDNEDDLIDNGDGTWLLVIDGDMTVTANFAQARRLDVDVVGNGSVVLDPEGPFYAEGSLVGLRPTAGTSWTFIGWGGDNKDDLIDNGDGTWLLVIDGDKAVTANFAQSGVVFLPLIGRSY
jgi:hypothetical protein